MSGWVDSRTSRAPELLRPLDARPHQRLADAPPAGGRVDHQHPEAGLVRRAGGLRVRAAAGGEGDRAEQPAAAVDGDQQLGASRRAARRPAASAGTASRPGVKPPSTVDAGGQLADPVVLRRPRRPDQHAGDARTSAAARLRPGVPVVHPLSLELPPGQHRSRMVGAGVLDVPVVRRLAGHLAQVPVQPAGAPADGRSSAGPPVAGALAARGPVAVRRRRRRPAGRRRRPAAATTPAPTSCRCSRSSAVGSSPDPATICDSSNGASCSSSRAPRGEHLIPDPHRVRA